MFKDQKIQYRPDDNTPQIDLQIQCNPYPNPSWLLCLNWQADPKISVEFERPRIANTILKKKNKDGSFLIWKFYYEAIVSKTVKYWHKIDIKVNRTELKNKP